MALGVLTTAILAVFGLLAWQDLSHREDQAARQGSDITYFVGREVARTFSEYDRQLARLAGQAAAVGMENAQSSRALWDDLVTVAAGREHVLSAVVLDATGTTVQHSERFGGLPVSAGDREFFKLLAADPGRGLVIGRPIVSRVTSRPIIVLARAVTNRNGAFKGVVMLTVAPEAFALYAGLPNLPAGSAIAIHRRDGINLFRAPLLPEASGIDLSGTALFTQHIPRAPVGVAHTPANGSVVDGSERLLAYRVLEDWPLVVVAGILRSEVLAGWRQDWLRNALLVSVALVGFSWLALIAQRHLTGALEIELSFKERELAQRAELERELRELATTDALTGLANRRHFIERAEAEFERAQRYGRPLSLLVFDVDHFKNVNDSFGHAVGDEALRTIVAAAGGCLRESDLLGRIGGEEFAILVPETALAGAAELAERLCAAVSEASFWGDRESRVALSVSIGVTDLAATDRSVDTLMVRADTALYRAKQGGRNRFDIAAAPSEQKAAQ